MITVPVHLYKLDELTPTARERAINNHRDFMYNMLSPDYIDGIEDWNDPEKLTMLAAEEQYILEHDDPIIESIEANGYYFFANGEICHTVEFCGNHPRRGEMDIHIHGEIITIQEVKTNV